MEEKKIIEGKFYNSKIIPIIGGIIAVLSLVYSIRWGTKWEHSIEEAISYGYFTPFWCGLIICIIFIVIYLWIGQCAIIVTDRRVYGKVAFGKQVDLPIDLISAVGTISLFKGVSVATSSGVIKFTLVKNSTEVFNAISALLRERQNKTNHEVHTTIKQEIPQSNADELKKYKDLLDNGVISQEEFDAKKKQLLGL